ncbi:DgyrCDS11384 [Dimorphilus gyrociliatus]|uniref:DgyrCDS11384 n=1 Tax=Dimorphilus gyrociliatus TaxID=2664684 RepID=A0A7I8W351_9ANNE|nr:DgyrCDS11384 [Dimorphilus gyrociliatus]
MVAQFTIGRSGCSNDFDSDLDQNEFYIDIDAFIDMYSEHDDRGSGEYDRNSRGRGRGRRGSRGSYNNNNYGRRGGRGNRGYNNSHSVVLNEDESMEGGAQGPSVDRYNPYNRSRNYQGRNSGDNNIQNRIGGSNYRRRNQRGHRGGSGGGGDRDNYSKKSYQNQGGGRKNKVIMDPDTVDKLKVAMSEKYIPATRSLDLSNFYKNEELNKDQIYLNMSDASNVEAILKIIKENIPELKSLNLSNNRLVNLRTWSHLKESAPELAVLDLSNNGVRYEQDIDGLKGFKITELCIDGNPICSNSSNNSSLISLVRKRVPDLEKLNNQKLPPNIKFDIESNCSLPPIKESYFGNDETKVIVVRFLEEYYKLFDSDARHLLFNAYHDSAMFSMSVNLAKLQQNDYSGYHNSSIPKRYISESRNLLKVYDSKRQSLLKKGKLSIVAYLNDSFPATKHDSQSFIVDVSHSSPLILTFTVHGLFTERDETRGDAKYARFFSRTFVTIPHNGGIVVVNEQLTIASPTRDQIASLSRRSAPTPSSSPVHVSPTVPSVPLEQTPDMRNSMIDQFSTWSGMKREFAEKLLREHNWQPERSGDAFKELNVKLIVIIR